MKFNGKSLKDDETLRQHKVEDGGTITTEPEFHGQYLPMGVQPSMEKKRKAEEELDKVVELAPEVAFDGEILWTLKEIGISSLKIQSLQKTHLKKTSTGGFNDS